MRAYKVLGTISVIMLAMAIVFFLVAVWTVGDNAARVGGTGAIILVVGILTGAAALVAWDER